MSTHSDQPVPGSRPERDGSRTWKEKAERFERRAVELSAQVARWKELAGANRERAEGLERRVRELEGRLELVKQRSSRTHRQVLSTRVLSATMALRARTASARAAIPSRELREAVLREVSAAYVTAAREGPARFGERAHRMHLQELHWWMPVTQPGAQGITDAWLAKQHFPYRAIAQTRELAVGGIMLDLGANTGRMSISRVVLGDVIAAYCAEPEPLNYTCLVGNVIDNGLSGLVLPDQVAIGERNGTVALRVAKSSGGHVVLGDRGASDIQSVAVPCLTLDSWLGRLRVDPDAVTFVKVDVQGFEARVLAGAPGLLSRAHVAWQLEVDPALLAAAGTPVPDLIAHLQRHFTHFIDLNGALIGDRARPIGELAEGLAYVRGGGVNHTDLLVFRARAEG